MIPPVIFIDVAAAPLLHIIAARRHAAAAVAIASLRH